MTIPCHLNKFSRRSPAAHLWEAQARRFLEFSVWHRRFAGMKSVTWSANVRYMICWYTCWWLISWFIIACTLVNYWAVHKRSSNDRSTATFARHIHYISPSLFIIHLDLSFDAVGLRDSKGYVEIDMEWYGLKDRPRIAQRYHGTCSIATGKTQVQGATVEISLLEGEEEEAYWEETNRTPESKNMPVSLTLFILFF